MVGAEGGIGGVVHLPCGETLGGAGFREGGGRKRGRAVAARILVRCAIRRC
jgi:hypothetical protein